MWWRTHKPVSRRRKPDGFILPSQPTLSTRAPSGERWLHELKIDGWRLLATRRSGVVRLFSRYTNDLTAHFTGIGEAIAALPGGDLVIDGEAVIFRPDGHSDFHALRSRRGAASAILVGFDLLQRGSEDVRRLALEKRRAALADLIDRRNGLLFSQQIEGDGDIIYRHACALGAEGIVSKMRGKPYSSGGCGHWLKTKNPDFTRA